MYYYIRDCNSGVYGSAYYSILFAKKIRWNCWSVKEEKRMPFEIIETILLSGIEKNRA